MNITREQLFEKFKIDLFEIIPHPDYKAYQILTNFFGMGRGVKFKKNDIVFAHKDFFYHTATRRFNAFSLEDFRRKFINHRDKVECLVILNTFIPETFKVEKDFIPPKRFKFYQVMKPFFYRNYKFKESEIIYTDDEYPTIRNHCTRLGNFDIAPGIEVTKLVEVDFQKIEAEANNIEREANKFNRNIKLNAVKYQMETNKNINELVNVMKEQAKNNLQLGSVVAMITEMKEEIHTLKKQIKGKK